MKKLNNKIAIITGGAKGIGLEVSRLFAQNGALVIYTDKNKKMVKNH